MQRSPDGRLWQCKKLHFVFTTHALRRCTERDIKPAYIVEDLSWVLDGVAVRGVHLSRLEFFTVVYERISTGARIITVYTGKEMLAVRHYGVLSNPSFGYKVARWRGSYNR